MQKNDKQLGRPFQEFADTKANIEALTGLTEGCIAYATDTNEIGTYDGATWTWGSGGGASVYAPIAKGVTNGDSHDHSGGDGAQIAYSSLSGRPSAESNSDYIYRCDNTGGDCSFVGTINTLPGGAVVTYNITSGNENALVPTGTTNLAKLRLYNTTRSTYALISACVTSTNTITLTANVPAGWIVGDSITIASQVVSGGGVSWVDLEITSGIVGKTSLFIGMQVKSSVASDALRIHPNVSYSVSKVIPILTQAANIQADRMGLLSIINNVFALNWSGSPTVVAIREMGYLE